MKYLHLLLHNETKFSEKLFCMLNNRELGFNPFEHCFITPHINVYKKLSDLGDNIHHIKKSNLSLINQYGDRANWIFIHALNLRKFQVIRIKKNIASKVIWRVWGHDILDKPKETNILLQTGKKLLDRLYVKKIRQFYGIGTGFKYDSILINERFGNVRTFPLSYTYQKGLEKIYHTLAVMPRVSNKQIRIMIGHSGNEIMNHIKVMESLRRLSEYPIQIVLVLSYGKKDYISCVKTYAQKHFHQENLEIIENFLPMDEYLRLLKSIDIAVFDQKGSAALGNLTPLLYFNKKFVLNKNGFMKRVFDIEKLKYITTEELTNISFEDLVKEFPTQKKEYQLVENRIKDNYVPNTWKNTFDRLSNCKGELV